MYVTLSEGKIKIAITNQIYTHQGQAILRTGILYYKNWQTLSHEAACMHRSMRVDEWKNADPVSSEKKTILLYVPYTVRSGDGRGAVPVSTYLVAYITTLLIIGRTIGILNRHYFEPPVLYLVRGVSRGEADTAVRRESTFFFFFYSSADGQKYSE